MVFGEDWLIIWIFVLVIIGLMGCFLGEIGLLFCKCNFGGFFGLISLGEFGKEFCEGFFVIGGFFFMLWGFLVFFFGEILVVVFLGFDVFLGCDFFLVIMSDIFFLVFFSMVIVCNEFVVLNLE